MSEARPQDELKTVRRLKRLLQAAEQVLLVKIQKEEFLAGADDLGFDPRYPVPVSRTGMESPARKRDTFTDDEKDADGKKITVRRVKSGIKRMHAEGIISDRHLSAALHFQSHFNVLGYDVIGTVNWMGTSGGGHGVVEDHLHRTSQSYQIVKGYLDAVGGADSVAGQVVFWLLGIGLSNREFTQEKKIDQEELKAKGHYFWQGILVGALDIMAAYYEGLSKSQRAMIRSSDYGGAFDMDKTGDEIGGKPCASPTNKKSA